MLFVLPSLPAFSQAKRSKVYEEYIKTYKSVAIDHLKRHKIPASITLAQGLLESGAGQSDLARRANNHFGIKCHSDWKGEKVYKSDDNPNDCFRKYKNASESFEDHAQFLKKARYSTLFTLKITDYRSWARGLQVCGYATDPAYANKLIKIIEDYDLYLYDMQGSSSTGKGNTTQTSKPPVTYKHTPYRTHGLIYIIARDGDTYESIASEFNFKVKDLCKYNEVPRGFPLNNGDWVYFENKKSKADKPYYEHIVKVGESMHSISQKYGLKVKNLYKLNKKDYEYVPVEGDILRLR
ncbi:glucosaminidase domain-containing protein [Dysgonomonas sp. 511]|uniref:glucosaminidase domain-containing protein n=1 Tax=Dysgonomonas sp. 511 TaxID=2302930 RepID=UPI00210487AC|nr:glucosaminidase domain-containing protein [Dysgonomonas sp. 511]